MALVRRYGLTAYRYSGQRRTTVMAQVSKKFVDQTLWLELQVLQATLQDYFDDFTSRIVAEVLNSDGQDAEER